VGDLSLRGLQFASLAQPELVAQHSRHRVGDAVSCFRFVRFVLIYCYGDATD
jgi:hypothetical protein